MKVGIFGMNVDGGLVMTEKPQWKASYSSITKRLAKLENDYQTASRGAFFIPISRWKAFGNKSGDAIETVTLASMILDKTKNIDVYASVHTFAYEPIVLAHIAARLNIEFDNRFKLNVLANWKKDEYRYFGKRYSASVLKKRYEKASEWVEKFKSTERQYFENELSSFGKKYDAFIPTELIAANFSPEGRSFNKKHGLGNLAPGSSLVGKSSNELSNCILPFSLFLDKNKQTAVEYHHYLTNQHADNYSADEYIESISQYNPLKGRINENARDNVISGSGVENLIMTPAELGKFFKICENKGVKAIAFSLPDYDKSLDLLYETIETSIKQREA